MIKTIPYCQLGKAKYNRGIRRAYVNRIKRDWRPELEHPVIVSFRDGKYWVIDHQHQTQAKFELNGCDPNMPVECEVHTGLTYEQEAELYYRLNTSSIILTFTEQMIGLIESKDDNAVKFRDIIESCGYVVGGKTSNSLGAVGAAWKIFNKADGAEKLTRILKLTQDCWPGNSSGVQSHMINGMLLFLKNHGDDFNRDHFIKVLSMTDPREIIRKAKIYYNQMDSKAFTMPYCTYSILINNYNIGLRNKLTPVAPGV